MKKLKIATIATGVLTFFIFLSIVFSISVQRRQYKNHLEYMQYPSTLTLTNTSIPTISISPTSIVTAEPTNTPDTKIRIAPEFVAENLSIMGLHVYMGIGGAEKIVGDYKSKKVWDNLESTLGYDHDCQYNFGKIGYHQPWDRPMDESYVIYVKIENSGIIGPAGIQLGDTVDEVISKFGIPIEYFNQKQSIIYDGHDSVGDIDYDDNGNVDRINFYSVDTYYVGVTVGFEDRKVYFYSIYEPHN